MSVLAVAAFLALTGWCVALSVIDLRERRLPNALTGPGAVTVLGAAAATGRGTAAVLGALLLAAPYLVIHLVFPAAFGAGDVKLALGLGAAAACGGAQVWVWAALTAPVLTALAGPLVRVRAHPARAAPADRAIPHGPAMCLATLGALLLAR
ncbi:prepilin peptidase [Nocardia jiangxiensis]|uniref:prepilin peptidase n=1 Tax=Nocardia jiangxiensis TaxID=282685 RepID=UPI0002DDF5E0|nr:prepilin peptidase [Nocardia jiangxiensis]